jgi:hypothetical protein
LERATFSISQSKLFFESEVKIKAIFDDVKNVKNISDPKIFASEFCQIFVLVQHTKTGKVYQKDHKLYQVTIKYTKWQQNRQNGLTICQHLSLQDTPKFTQILIFGMKIYLRATIVFGGKCDQNCAEF